MFCFDHDLKIDIDLLFDFDSSHSKIRSYENYDVMALFDFDLLVLYMLSLTCYVLLNKRNAGLCNRFCRTEY